MSGFPWAETGPVIGAIVGAVLQSLFGPRRYRAGPCLLCGRIPSDPPPEPESAPESEAPTPVLEFEPNERTTAGRKRRQKLKGPGR
jgi:hypothetical protein